MGSSFFHNSSREIGFLSDSTSFFFFFTNFWLLLLAVVEGYLHYKTILCHKVALDVQLMNFLFEEKIMFHSPDIQIFVFLGNLQISKSVMSS